MMTKRLLVATPLLLLTVSSVAYAGTLSPSASPAATFHTLSDIYHRLTTNTTSTEGNHSFSAPGTVAGSGYTLEQVYDAIPTIDPSKVLAGTTYLGVDGTIATRTPSASTGSFLAGFYNAFNLSAIDTDFIADNIKDGVNLFGIIGTALAEGSWVGTATSDLDMSGFDVLMPTGSTITDGTNTAIDPYNRTLNDAAGNVMVDWTNANDNSVIDFNQDISMNGYYLRMDGGPIVEVGDIYMPSGSVINDGSFVGGGNTAIDPYNRTLNDSSGNSMLAWNGYIQLLGNELDMNDGGGFGGGDIYMDGGDIRMPSGSVITDGTNTAIDPYNRTLNDTTGSAVLNWANGYLEMGTSTIYSNGTLSIDPYNRKLYRSDGTTVAVDWSSGLNVGSSAVYGTSGSANGYFDHSEVTFGNSSTNLQVGLQSWNYGDMAPYPIVLATQSQTPYFTVGKFNGGTLDDAHVRTWGNDIYLNDGTGTDGGDLRMDGGTLYANGTVLMGSLPTSDPAVVGQLWNDNGTLKVSAG